MHIGLPVRLGFLSVKLAEIFLLSAGETSFAVKIGNLQTSAISFYFYLLIYIAFIVNVYGKDPSTA